MADKGTLINAIEAAFRSMEPGEDCVRSLAEKLADAMDAFNKSGVINTHSVGGNCTASGTHPTLNSTGDWS